MAAPVPPSPGAEQRGQANRRPRRWRAAYALVLVHLAAWIAGLWLFSRIFGGAS